MNSELLRKGTESGSNDPFSVSDVEHELVSKYNPRFIGEGGKQLVYEVDGHPDTVIKISKRSIQDVIDANIAAGRPADVLSDDTRRHLEGEIEKENARHSKLKKFFGPEHVPTQRMFLCKVPVTPKILNIIYGKEPPATSGEVWCIATAQRRKYALEDRHKFPVRVTGIEHGSPNPSLYNRLIGHLVFGQEPEKRVTADEFFRLYNGQEVKRLWDEAQKDDRLRAALVDFVERTIEYAEQIKEMPDLVGKDNVVFHWEGNAKWTYTMIDAVYPETEAIDRASLNLSEFFSRGSMPYGKEIFMRALNFTSTINGLAELLGIPKRIHMPPHGFSAKDANLFNMFARRY